MILVGDIGGTKTVLAVTQSCGVAPKLDKEVHFASREYARFGDLLSEYLHRLDEVPTSICLGVAGPVLNGQCKATNLPWVLDERELMRASGARSARLLNDVEAASYGVLTLVDDEAVILNEGRRNRGNIAVIAAGTGLGEAALVWDGHRYVAMATEGGHVDFAPRTDREIELLRFLRAEFDRVSYERVLSGPGQQNIYRFLRCLRGGEEPEWLRAELGIDDPSAVISRAGLAKRDPVCVEALELFASLYGAEAGNLALKTFAVGGVVIGGGIAPKIVEKLRDGEFMRAFIDKGRYRSFMESIPVKVALSTNLALMGAAQFAIAGNLLSNES